MSDSPEVVAQKVVDAAMEETDPFMREILLATAAGYLAKKSFYDPDQSSDSGGGAMSADDESRILSAALGDECHEGVSRRGEFQPCNKPSVAVRVDPVTLVPYPVCAFHSRGSMVHLDTIVSVILAANEADREPSDSEGGR